MTDTYTGWDGKDYPWPPPEGWYEASDGRWWAPGTGPNPPPETPAPPSRPQSFATGDPGDRFDYPSDDEPGTTQLAHSASHRPSYGEPPTTPGGGHSHTPPSGVNYGATSSFAAGDLPGGPTTNRTPAIESSLPPPGSSNVPLEPQGGGGGRRFLFLGLGVLLALVVLGGAYVFLSDSGEETAADGTTTESTAEGADGEGTDTSGATDTTANGSSTTDDAGSSTTTESDSDTTSTTDDDGASTTLAADPAMIDQFRSLLQDNGLTSDRLTDADVLGFGTSFCTLASTSSSPEVFNEFREEAIESTANTSLAPEELGLVIDSAIVAFCPEEANRLGIEI